MIKKQMRACYQCEHLGSDERCKVSGVMECYYDPTEFGHQVAEQPKMRMFKQRKDQPVLIDEFLGNFEDVISCLRCGRTTAADVIVCDVCARTGIVNL